MCMAIHVLQCVAVCCSMLQYVVAGCCNVLQIAQRCVYVWRVMWCSMLQCVAVCCCRMLQRDTALCMSMVCHVLQYIAECCSVLQCAQDGVAYCRLHSAVYV